MQYKDRGVFFFAVFGGSSEKDIREFAESHKITYPVGKDNGIVDAFGIRVIPQTFFFAKEGKFVKRIRGCAMHHEFSKTLDKILAGN